MRTSIVRLVSIGAAFAFMLSMLATFSCGQKRDDDSAQLALVAYLVAIGVLRPSAIVRPGGDGVPEGDLAPAPCTEGQLCELNP